MVQLSPDEKTTTVMVYSRNKLIHGDLVTRQAVKVSILPRMQIQSNYLHFFAAQVWFFGGGEPRLLKYAEYFFPVERMIAFHLAPPAADSLDYDSGEVNRAMSEFNIILGVFLLKGKIRVSTQVELSANLELAHKAWLSVYDAEITSPFLVQMPVIRVPMLLVNPGQVSFGILDQ